MATTRKRRTTTTAPPKPRRRRRPKPKKADPMKVALGAAAAWAAVRALAARGILDGLSAPAAVAAAAHFLAPKGHEQEALGAIAAAVAMLAEAGYTGAGKGRQPMTTVAALGASSTPAAQLTKAAA